MASHLCIQLNLIMAPCSVQGSQYMRADTHPTRCCYEPAQHAVTAVEWTTMLFKATHTAAIVAIWYISAVLQRMQSCFASLLLDVGQAVVCSSTALTGFWPMPGARAALVAVVKRAAARWTSIHRHQRLAAKVFRCTTASDIM
jgi:hypothetical protein